ncbi:Uncharacterised protein [Legionella pneumophila]|nr:Uncharacterised protein [Legionella pneumophila]CZJ48412.1 Uncharacterised protein [Legionella pneumophila]CZR05508.1 Uncharacterised protein [Legionella pneumophila]STX66884.1 Uncharacterised protein [Legionella pneumophila]GAN24084.1 hypothetical protein lptwr_01981 [Legionella pneumophila]
MFKYPLTIEFEFNLDENNPKKHSTDGYLNISKDYFRSR